MVKLPKDSLNQIKKKIPNAPCVKDRIESM